MTFDASDSPTPADAGSADSPSSEVMVRPAASMRREVAVVVMVLDAAIDLAARGLGVAGRASGIVERFGRPIVSTLIRPPLVPQRYWPITAVSGLAAHGQPARRSFTDVAVKDLTDTVVTVLDAVLDQIDLTQLVLSRVDIEEVIASVDLDKVVASIDMNALIDRVPIDRVLDRVDIDEVASRIDLDKIVSRIDVNEIAAGIDLDAIIDRIDLAAIANRVITEIDLPELIRESSGAMASESVLGVRTQGIEADEWVNRLVDRILMRRNDRLGRTKTRLDLDRDEGLNGNKSESGTERKDDDA
jgi:hypothetical protein